MGHVLEQVNVEKQVLQQQLGQSTVQSAAVCCVLRDQDHVAMYTEAKG